MRLIYAIPIILLPNTAHLPSDVSVGISFALLLLAMLLGDREPAYLAKRGYLFAPLMALFVAMFIGFVAAQWHDVSRLDRDLREGKVALLYPFLYLAYLHCGLDLKRTRQLIVLLLLVAVGAGVEALLQALSFDLGTFSETQRVTGPFGDIKMANRAGVFFAMFLPVLVALVLQPKQKKNVRVAAAAGSLVLVLAILFTFSRQSYLIALFAIMVLLVWRSIPMAVLAAVLLAVATLTVVPKSVVERVQQTEEADGSGSMVLDPSTQSRFTIWQGTLDMLRDHPNGVGLGRFNDHIGTYTNYAGKDAHNGFLLTLAECGPLGLLALLWVFWRLWRLSRWLRRSPNGLQPEDRALERGFTLAVVSMALGNMYGSPFFDSLIMANFWILCGLMERYGNIKAHAVQVVTQSKERRVIQPFGQRFPLATRVFPGLARIRDARR
ncbi:O-antigen ligase family protein [Lysobacter solisilvae (ex Woo and Kim 2020)]|uniref:O-antigen ligase family protein n=1 Tax=Agrilutibacter terrestris TaxID=2865112 RepID=A0A7H0FXC8_9GAMM|nr:O-antigen ligase family protein [Lysobacter terrestris]QNP40694.1 O-antigen ligase family protein [Lysobacter terrestris]